MKDGVLKGNGGLVSYTFNFETRDVNSYCMRFSLVSAMSMSTNSVFFICYLVCFVLFASRSFQKSWALSIDRLSYFRHK